MFGLIASEDTDRRGRSDPLPSVISNRERANGQRGRVLAQELSCQLLQRRLHVDAAAAENP